MQVPDAIEPAIGYRVWLVKNGRLYSVVHHQEWVPGKVLEGLCNAGKTHDVPDPGCTCGVYAAATFNRLFEMGYTRETGLFSVPNHEITIAGQIKLWGRVIPASRGWRAQYATPHKLLVPYTKWKFAKPLSEIYNVPYKLYNLERKH